jgi:hypothetical protein
MTKTAKDITMNVLAGQSVVVDPVAKLLEKEALLKQVRDQFGIAGSDPKKQKGHTFVGEQEQELGEKRKEYYNEVVEAGLATAYLTANTVFDMFDFKLIITPKT